MSITKGMVVTDLDGTLLKRDRTISETDIETLNLLKEKSIIRVIATGRNIKKIEAVIRDISLFDYFIFSSGAGIMNCKSRKIELALNIPKDNVNSLIHFFIKKGVAFFLFHAIPQNHLFWYYKTGKINSEYNSYCEHNKGCMENLPDIKFTDKDNCQFLVIFRTADEFFKLKDEIENNFDDFQIIRASSPYGTDYIWMEVFNKKVSKGNAARYLCNHLDIDSRNTIGIGNDYNDLALLDFTSHSYITDNCPNELKGQYESAPANDENAFSFCISKNIN